MAEQPPPLSRDIAGYGDPDVSDDEFVKLYNNMMAETLESLPSDLASLVDPLTRLHTQAVEAWESSFAVHRAICGPDSGWESGVIEQLPRFYKVCFILSIPDKNSESMALLASVRQRSTNNPIDNAFRFSIALLKLVWPDDGFKSSMPTQSVPKALATITRNRDGIKALSVPDVDRDAIKLEIRDIAVLRDFRDTFRPTTGGDDLSADVAAKDLSLERQQILEPLLAKLSARRSEILRYLWDNRETTVGDIIRNVYGASATTMKNAKEVIDLLIDDCITLREDGQRWVDIRRDKDEVILKISNNP